MSQPSGKPIYIPPFAGVRLVECWDHFELVFVPDDVFCLHCDGVFKAQDVVGFADDWPNCPVCQSSSPIDFAGIPWWRDDLVGQTANEDGFVYRWLVRPIDAVFGEAILLEPRDGKFAAIFIACGVVKQARPASIFPGGRAYEYTDFGQFKEFFP